MRDYAIAMVVQGTPARTHGRMFFNLPQVDHDGIVIDVATVSDIGRVNTDRMPFEHALLFAKRGARITRQAWTDERRALVLAGTADGSEQALHDNTGHSHIHLTSEDVLAKDWVVVLAKPGE